MSVQDFIFRIGGDITDFKKSISDVEKELDNWKEKLKSATGQGIVEANKNIDNLTKTIQNLKKVGFQDLEKRAGGAQNALFSLNQVTRDLPFGFIAIQNNLPLVFDSFANLTKEAGGLSSGLKALGASLIGPAGISFAVSAVISGVTALIQKYGSFGEAINAILGASNTLTEQQKEYNKASFEAAGNIATEEAKLSILLKTINNTETPQKNRLAAYNELKKVSPDVVAGIRDENALTAESIQLINANATARVELLRLKITEAGITAVLSKNAEQLAEATEAERLAKLKAVQAQKDYNNNVGKFVNAPGAAGGAILANKTILDDANEAQAEATKRVNELIKIQDNYIKQLDPIVEKTSKINAATQARIDGLKKEDQATKEATKNAKTSLKNRQKDQEQELRDAISINQDRIKRQAYLNAVDLDNLRRNVKERRKIEREAGAIALVPEQLPTLAPSININVEELKRQGEEANAVLANLQKQARQDAALKLLNDTFFNPLTDLFDNFLQTGKFTFSEFAKTILATVKRLVAQLIATGILKLLASILTGGGSTAAGALGGAAKATKGIGGFLKGVLGGFLGGGVAAPQFGGVQAGALSMGGQVNLSLRGADLVGSINRTNTIINRIG